MEIAIAYLGPLFLVLSVWQFRSLRKRLSAESKRIIWPLLLVYAMVGVLLAIVAACAVGYAVMFGPSHLTGDFTGLPWFTGFPAVGFGLLVLVWVSNWFGETIVKKL